MVYGIYSLLLSLGIKDSKFYLSVHLFQCIFRKPKECKERHKILMDRNGGDGADSAEDSGSSQPYPSTLPGIPKACFLFSNLYSATLFPCMLVMQ